MEPAINFCCTCAAPVVLKVPAGDSLPRHVCEACGAIHYRNPRLVIGTLPVWEDRVLLCRRAIEPRKGCWTLPAGFMENGESTGEGAQRETVEEAGAVIELGGLFSVLDIPQVEQVHMFFMASMVHPRLDPGPESLEARLFTEAEIPWDDIAFRTVSQTLRWFFEDRRAGAFRLHTDVIRYDAAAR